MKNGMDDQDGFENVYSGEEVKKMTEQLTQQIEQLEKGNDILRRDNMEVKNEINKIKIEFEKKNTQLQRSVLNLAQCLRDKSVLYEENMYLKQLVKGKCASECINLLSWRSEEETDVMILEMAQTIEDLKKAQENNEQASMKQLQKSNSLELNKSHKKEEELQKQLNSSKQENSIIENELHMLQKAVKEKEFFLEAALTHLENLDPHIDRKQQVLQYVSFIVQELKSIIIENALRFDIKLVIIP